MTEDVAGGASVRLDLRNVRGPSQAVVRAFPASALGRDEGFTVAAPIELGLDVRKDGDKYSLRGRLVTTVRRECSRCLEPFDVPTAVDIDVRYPAVPGQYRRGGARDFRGGPVDCLLPATMRSISAALVREQLQLAAPMKPLCDDGCRGLCPRVAVRTETARHAGAIPHGATRASSPCGRSCARPSVRGRRERSRKRDGEPETTSFEGPHGEAPGARCPSSQSASAGARSVTSCRYRNRVCPPLRLLQGAPGQGGQGGLGPCAAERSAAEFCDARSWSGGMGRKRRACEAFRGAGVRAGLERRESTVTEQHAHCR